MNQACLTAMTWLDCTMRDMPHLFWCDLTHPSVTWIVSYGIHLYKSSLTAVNATIECKRISMSHVSYEMSHFTHLTAVSATTEYKCTYMNYVAYEWGMTHMSDVTCECVISHMTYERVMSHSCQRNDWVWMHMNDSYRVWMRHDIYESCHVWMHHITYDIWASHVSQLVAQRLNMPAYQWVMSHMNRSCHVWNESCHIWISHVTLMSESCLTAGSTTTEYACISMSHVAYEWVMTCMKWVLSHTWISHVTHINESCHTYK